MNKGGLKNAAYLLLGAAAGTIAGLLFAPKPGKETRKDLKNWLDEKREKSAEAVEKFRKDLPAHKEKLTAAINTGRGYFKRGVKPEAEKVEV